jgi:beta-aspartyl-dipeptidase (metallo-type)
VFDEDGVCISVKTAPVDTLQKVFRDLVLSEKIPVEKALKLFTSNVSEFFGISDEGHGFVKENGIANLVFYDDALNLKMTIAKGDIKVS